MGQDKTALVNENEGMLSWGRRVGLVREGEGLGTGLTSEDAKSLRALWIEHGGVPASK